jgi:WD40 repeat protein
MGCVRSLAFSPDGKSLASGSNDVTVRLWDVKTGEQKFGAGVSNVHGAVAFTPDGKSLALGGGDDIGILDLATRKVRRLCKHKNTVWSLSFSPDGKLLASASGWDQRVRLWDAATGKEVRPIGESPGRYGCVQFTPDGKSLVASTYERGLVLWDIATRRARPLLGDNWAAAVTPDGKTLACAGKSADVVLLDLPGGRERRRLKGPAGGVNVLALSPDSKTVAAGGDNTIYAWDVASGKPVFKSLRLPSFIHTLSFSADGRTLAWTVAAVNDPVHLTDLATGRELRQIKDDDHNVFGAVFAPRGDNLLAFHGLKRRPRLYEAATGQPRRTLPVDFGGQAAAFSPDGRLLALAQMGQPIQVWDVIAGKVVGRLAGHPSEVFALAFSPDGRTLASGGFDNTILLWDVGSLPRPAPARTKLEASELDRLWAALAGADGPKAYDAECTLIQAPGSAVPFLKGKVKPAPPVDGKRVARLVADLDSKRFVVRQKATEELEKLGDRAYGALRAALEKQPSVEMRRRLEVLLAKVEGNLAGEALRVRRVLEVLELAGTREARGMLADLAKGDTGSPVTAAAKEALARTMKKRN